MIIGRCYDALLIRRIMLRLWDTVAEDGQDKMAYVPNVLDDCWLSVLVGGDVIGVYHVHRRNGVTLEIHAQILPEYRKEHSVESGWRVLKWLVKNAEFEKLIAQIPVIYPNVRKFTETFGFVEEGCLTKSYLKDGKLLDVWIMAHERNRLEEEINGQFG